MSNVTTVFSWPLTRLHPPRAWPPGTVRKGDPQASPRSCHTLAVGQDTPARLPGLSAARRAAATVFQTPSGQRPGNSSSLSEPPPRGCRWSPRTYHGTSKPTAKPCARPHPEPGFCVFTIPLGFSQPLSSARPRLPTPPALPAPSLHLRPRRPSGGSHSRLGGVPAQGISGPGSRRRRQGGGRGYFSKKETGAELCTGCRGNALSLKIGLQALEWNNEAGRRPLWGRAARGSGPHRAWAASPGAFPGPSFSWAPENPALGVCDSHKSPDSAPHPPGVPSDSCTEPPRCTVLHGLPQDAPDRRQGRRR